MDRWVAQHWVQQREGSFTQTGVLCRDLSFHVPPCLPYPSTRHRYRHRVHPAPQETLFLENSPGQLRLQKLTNYPGDENEDPAT